MAKFTGWDEKTEYELKECPFCGGEADAVHIGNLHTKSRKIEIKCKKCRCKKINAAIRHNFDWLEKVAVEDWNQRPVD